MNRVVALSQIGHKAEQIALYALIAIIAGLAGLYFYLISASVVHVVMSKEIEEKMNKLHSDIASLEAVYMEKQHSISLEVVERSGYLAAGKKIFIDRGEASLVTRR